MSFVKCSSQSVLFNSLQGSSIAHFVIDKGHKIAEWNRACEVLAGYSASRMIGTANHWMAFYSSQRLFLPDLILDNVSQSALIKSCKNMKLKKSSLLKGAYEIEGFFTPLGKAGRWLRFTAAPLKDAKGKIAAVIVTLEDTSAGKTVENDKERLNKELIKTNRKLKTMVLKDYDTGLFNHRFLGEVLSVELTRSKRTGQPLSLLMLDIDYFKSINSMYGRQFGNLVLQQLANFLKKLVRKYDLVFRYGGEEFVIVSPGIESFQGRMQAQRILEEINLYNFGDEKNTVKLKISIAVVSYPEDKILKSEDLVEVAELILIKAKECGGNRVYTSYDSKKLKSPAWNKKSREENIQGLKHKLERITRRVNQNLIEAIFAFSKAIELRDHYTGEHVEKTVFYATQIGRMLNLKPEELEDIRQAAILHDLGKLGISDKILLKNSKLTDEEYAQIKKHPKIAADILRPIHFLRSVIPYILYHHERWDGRGYPCGLKADLIPVGARIIAIADVFQALTSNRPYRKAFSWKEAIKIIKEGAGTQFDPKIVRVFLKLIYSKKRVSSLKAHLGSDVSY